MERLRLHDGVAAAFRLIDAANLFIADTQPWAMAKDDASSERLTGVLAEAAEAVRIAAILLSPVMPSSTAEILRRMGETRAPREIRLDDAEWRTSGEKKILNEGPLWPRKETMSDPQNSQSAPNAGDTGSADTPKISRCHAGGAERSHDANARQPDRAADPGGRPAPATAPTTGDDRIAIEDFMKVELRTARILEAERVPKSKKLVKMRVDVGTEQRTIVAGIAEAYEPEALVGKTVVIVANLKPAKLMGIESNGMVLAASPDGGLPIVVNAEPAVPGTRVR